MRNVRGYVLAKETNLGIPNLVVALFDSNLNLEDVREKAWSATFARELGRRIASVLTDQNGSFSLSAEDLEFSGNEPRPDLLLIVLAPEDVDDPKRPYPRPVEERTLYVSSVPRVCAGAEESYVIRLLQARLQAAGIPEGTGRRDPGSAADELANMTLASYALRRQTNERLAEQRAKLLKAEYESRASARELLTGLSAIPRHRREMSENAPTLLITDSSRLAADLPKCQKDAIEHGLNRLKEVDYQPTMQLYLTEDDVKKLKLTVEGDKISGKVGIDKLRDAVHRLVNPNDLIRDHDFELPDVDELERRYLTPSATAQSKKTEGKKTEPNKTEKTDR